VGGTPVAIATFDTNDNVGYISTDGGTLLKFLEPKPCRPLPYLGRVRQNRRVRQVDRGIAAVDGLEQASIYQ
jgi:hypothetical protein